MNCKRALALFLSVVMIITMIPEYGVRSNASEVKTVIQNNMATVKQISSVTTDGALTQAPYTYDHSEGWAYSSSLKMKYKNNSVALGGTFTSRVNLNVESGYTVSYQWQSYDPSTDDYTDILGETSSQYTHTMTAQEYKSLYDAGKKVQYYMCVVKSVNASDQVVYTDYFRQGITEKTGFIQDTASADAKNTTTTVSVGGKVVITGPYMYCDESLYRLKLQWQKYDSTSASYIDVDGKSDYKLTIDSVSASDFGKYRLSYQVTPLNVSDEQSYTAASGTYGTYTLSEVTGITVEAANSVTEYTQNVGDSVELGVKAWTANDNNYTLSYRWAKDGVTLEGVVYPVISKVLTSDDFGEYICTVTAVSNTDATVSESKQMTFTISQKSTLNVSSPETGEVYYPNAKVGDTVQLNVNASTSISAGQVTYTWYKYVDDATTSDYVKITGALGYDYTVNIQSDDDLTSYMCQITDGSESATRVFVFNKIYQTRISSAFDSTIYRNVGDSAKFKIAIDSIKSTESYSFVWKKDKLAMADQISDTLEFTSLTASDFGKYSCVVTNDSTLSSKTIYFYLYENAAVKFTDISNNPNGSCRVGDHITLGVDVDNQSNCSLKYSWEFCAQSTQNGKVYFGEPVTYSADTAILDMTSITKEQFGIYYLNVYQQMSDVSSTCVYSNSYTVQGNDYGLWCTAQGNGYYYYSRKTGESVKFAVESYVEAEAGSNTDVTYKWYRGRSAASYTDDAGVSHSYYKYDYLIQGAESSSYDISSVDSADYGNYYCIATCGDASVAVYFYLKNTYNLSVNWDTDIIGATNLIHNLNRKLGTSASMSVDATCDYPETITYQWAAELGSATSYTNINGATASTYNVSNITDDDYGIYRCTISDGYDSISVFYRISKLSTLKISVTSETSYAAGVGDTLTFTAEATDTDGGNIVYQWYRYDARRGECVAISGATDKVYTTSPLTKEDIEYCYYYQCKASSGADTVTSSKIYLNDKNEYSVLVQSVHENIMLGDGVSYTATVNNGTAGATYSYQWYAYDEDGNYIKMNGANAATYSAVSVDKVNDNITGASDGCYGYVRYACAVKEMINGNIQNQDYDYMNTRVFTKELTSYTGLPGARAVSGSVIQRYTEAGADSIDITFDSYMQLPAYDNTDASENFTGSTIWIIDGNGTVTYALSGAKMQGNTYTVSGDAFTIYMQSDPYAQAVSNRIVTDNDTYGYRVTNIEKVVNPDNNSNNDADTSDGDNSAGDGNGSGSDTTSGSSINVINKKAVIGVKEKLSVKLNGAKYKSSKKKVASVNKKGVITGNKKGNAKIVVTTSKQKITYKITVKKAPKKIVKLKEVKKKLKKGKTFTIKAVLPKGTASYHMTYKSSNKKIATVSRKGKVKAKKKGKVTITVKTYNGKKKKVKVRVVE